MKIKLIVTLMIGTLISASAQNTKDPYKKNSKKVKTIEIIAKAPYKNYNLVQEVFIMSQKNAAELQRENISDIEIYQRMLSKYELDSITILRLLPGQRAATAGVEEVIYATEYKTVGPNDDKKKGVGSAVNPSSFETRNIGLSLEAEINVSGGGFILARIMIEDCQYTGDKLLGQEKYKIKMPQFHSQRIDTEVLLKPRLPFVIGTMNSKVTKEKSGSSDQVRMVIITAKPVA